MRPDGRRGWNQSRKVRRLTVSTVVVWEASSGESMPEDFPPVNLSGAQQIEKCTECDEHRVRWPEDGTQGNDPWKTHLCDPDNPFANTWVGIEWTGDGRIRGWRANLGR